MPKKTKISLAVLGIFLLVGISCWAVDRNRQANRTFIDDSVITSAVKRELLREPTLRKVRFDVETFRGVVLLSGFVDSRQAAKKAVKITKSVAGVNSVKNSIALKNIPDEISLAFVAHHL